MVDSWEVEQRQYTRTLFVLQASTCKCRCSAKLVPSEKTNKNRIARNVSVCCVSATACSDLWRTVKVQPCS